MIDFAKVYCKAHPYEPVNNFCADKNCLVGLCPTCVCEHTAMHMQNKTQPQFQNIRATFSRVHNEIQGQIDVVVADKERLANLMGSIKEKKENFKAVLMNSRNDCLQLVKDHFDGLQKQWEEEIANEEKRHTLHNSYRLDTLSALLSKEISELIDQSRRMNSVSFVEEIPRIQKETLVDSRAFHTRISQELDDNERYTPIINYSPEYLKEIGEGLKRLLSLEFSIPIKKYISSTNSQLMSRVGNISFRGETPKKDGAQMQHTLVIRRPSSEKMPHQQQQTISMTQSALYSVPSVPMVLTTSFLNSPPHQAKPHSNQSQVIEKSRMSKINFTPNYVDRVQLNKFAKGDMQTLSRSTLKHKKSGLSLLGNQCQGECGISQKENSRK